MAQPLHYIRANGFDAFLLVGRLADKSIGLNAFLFNIMQIIVQHF